MDEFYSEVYLDHFFNPRFIGLLDRYTHSAEFTTEQIGCYDQVELRLNIVNQILTDASFRGRLCSGSISAMSLCLTSVMGKSLQEIQKFTPEDLAQLWGWVPKGKEHSIDLAIKVLHRAIGQHA
ncbi:MAG: iron-sulfur cluster assembly scaffold protein [bacterium]|nr:iron-sulfur cluster assembly scaffold protein [bacterium]